MNQLSDPKAKDKRLKLKSALKNALEIADRGGVIMASDWVTGRYRHVSKRPIPDFCDEGSVYWACDLPGKSGQAARRLAKKHPRCRKMIAVVDWRRLNLLTKEYRAAREEIRKQARQSALSRLEQIRAECERDAEEARRKAQSKIEASGELTEWLKAPHHPAPAEVLRAKRASGLSWTQFEKLNFAERSDEIISC